MQFRNTLKGSPIQIRILELAANPTDEFKPFQDHLDVIGINFLDYLFDPTYAKILNKDPVIHESSYLSAAVETDQIILELVKELQKEQGKKPVAFTQR